MLAVKALERTATNEDELASQDRIRALLLRNQMQVKPLEQEKETGHKRGYHTLNDEQTLCALELANEELMKHGKELKEKHKPTKRARPEQQSEPVITPKSSSITTRSTATEPVFSAQRSNPKTFFPSFRINHSLQTAANSQTALHSSPTRQLPTNNLPLMITPPGTIDSLELRSNLWAATPVAHVPDEQISQQIEEIIKGINYLKPINDPTARLKFQLQYPFENQDLRLRQRFEVCLTELKQLIAITAQDLLPLLAFSENRPLSEFYENFALFEESYYRNSNASSCTCFN